jgi:Phosphotransferase enzyme family
LDADGLPGCPAGLRDALREHDAEVVRLTDHAPRYHVRLQSAGEPLFAWYSGHPSDRGALEHELAVRAAVGDSGVLRCPAVLAHGEDWRLERMIEPEPYGDFGLVVEAWSELTRLTLPKRGGGGSSSSRLERLERWARLARSPLPISDVVRARRMSFADNVTVHGDFHAAHVLPRHGAVWVIDWELSGKGPRGMDLMQLWASLPDSSERERLWAAAVKVVPEPELCRLRYVALVRRISSKVAELSRFGDRDLEDAQRLLALLPEARAALS